MNWYVKLSVILALALYLPLSWQILKKEVEQNMLTFLLWGTLDAVAALSIIRQGGNWYLPAAYVGGCIIVVSSLIVANVPMRWTRFETAIAMLFGICLVGWVVSGPRMATILSTSGVLIATGPQLRDTYKDPSKQPVMIYLGFTVANILSTLGGSSWSIEERLYPAACTVLCLVVAMLAMRKPHQGFSMGGV
jgi:hypothetical protein